MDIEKGKYVVVDLETTGLDVNRDFILEIGAVKIENGVVAGAFSSFASSLQLSKLSEEITTITGITDADIKNAPPIECVLERFVAFAHGCTLVAHNLPFVFAFLRNWGFWCGVDFDPFAKDAIDTLEYAESVLGNNVKDCKLSTLAKHFGIRVANRRALSEAEATAKVFTALAKIK